MVEKEDTWRYISWSKQSCIFDIMWLHDVRMYVTIVFFCKSVWKTTKLWIWKDVNSVPFLCDDTNPTNWFFIIWIILKQLLDKFQLVDFWIAFLFASLRIDEWWISSHIHNLANLFVVVQSTNSISSSCQENTFWAWTVAILLLKLLPWWSMEERVYSINLQLQLIHCCHRPPISFLQLFFWWFQVIQYFWIGSNASFIIWTINVYFVSRLGRKTIFANMVLKNQQRTCCGCLVISVSWRNHWI